MFDIYIAPEEILRVEMACGYFCIFSSIAWVFFRNIPIRLVFLISAITIMIFGSYRYFDYNSDTRNYASYFAAYSLERQLTLFGLSKLEPVHIFLIYISKDFSEWLRFEAIVCIVSLVAVFFREKRIPPFLFLSSFVITLNTSSMRFSMSCIILALLMTGGASRLKDWIRITIVAASTHAVMLASGAFASRKSWVPWVFAIIFFIASIYVSSVGDRVNIDTAEVKSVGAKSFIVLLLVLFHRKFYDKTYAIKKFILDIIGFSVIFIFTALMFPAVNRIIIIGMLCFVFSQDYSDLTRNSMSARMVTALVVILIVAPYVYFTPDLFFSNRW